MSTFDFMMNAVDFVKDVLPFVILALALIVVIVVIIFFVKKSKKPTEYTPDEIDRSVDEAARKKAAARDQAKTADEVKVSEKAPDEDNSEEKHEVKSVEEAMASGEDEQEEITFEAEDVDEKPETPEGNSENKETPTKRKTVSYRILYDKETKTWEIRKDNAKRVIRRVKTKKEALEIAQELSERQDLNLVVHKKDGKFQKIRK